MTKDSVRGSGIEHVSTSKRKKREVAAARKTNNLHIVGMPLDRPFLVIVLILLVIGVLMMGSASYVWSMNDYGTGTYYFNRQALLAIAGVLAMLGLSFVDYHFWQNTKVAYIVLGVTFFITLITSFVGTEVAGARRWIDIAGVSFQPSELLKVAFIIIFAYLGAMNFPKFNDIRYSIGAYLIILAPCCGVLVLQRHLSGVLIFGLIGMIMILISGVPIRHFALLCTVAVIGAGGFLLLKMAGSGGGFGYITERIQSWRDPTSDILGSTLQTYQSLMAIGSGGVFGLGFGQSRQKHLWLPEAQNDFVFSIVCEELGFVGAMAVIILFALFIFRGFYIASNAPDRFGMLLCAGVTVQIGIQALLNIGVACNAFPNTGISLPFFSYGGTATMVQLAEMGLILSVSRQASRQE